MLLTSTLPAYIGGAFVTIFAQLGCCTGALDGLHCRICTLFARLSSVRSHTLTNLVYAQNVGCFTDKITVNIQPLPTPVFFIPLVVIQLSQISLLLLLSLYTIQLCPVIATFHTSLFINKPCSRRRDWRHQLLTLTLTFTKQLTITCLVHPTWTLKLSPVLNALNLGSDIIFNIRKRRSLLRRLHAFPFLYNRAFLFISLLPILPKKRLYLLVARLLLRGKGQLRLQQLLLPPLLLLLPIIITATHLTLHYSWLTFSHHFHVINFLLHYFFARAIRRDPSHQTEYLRLILIV